MEKRIIYTDGDGHVLIIIPSHEAVGRFGIKAIAKKDVPSGRPYKIVDADTIPVERAARNAWSVDDALLTDGLGGASNEFD